MVKISLSPAIADIKGSVSAQAFSQRRPTGISYSFPRRVRSPSSSAKANGKIFADLSSYWNAQRTFLKNTWQTVGVKNLSAFTAFIAQNFHRTQTGKELFLCPPDDPALGPFGFSWAIYTLSAPFRLQAKISGGAGENFKVLFRYAYPYWGTGLQTTVAEDIYFTLRVNSLPAKWQAWICESNVLGNQAVSLQSFLTYPPA